MSVTFVRQLVCRHFILIPVQVRLIRYRSTNTCRVSFCAATFPALIPTQYCFVALAAISILPEHVNKTNQVPESRFRSGF